MTTSDLRHKFMHAGLDEASVAADPFKQFERWFHAATAAGVHLPNAMSYDVAGFVFYTNYSSRKGRELAANPHACLLFSWVELERQVRIEGRVGKVSDAESDEYFASRPLGSRLGAWASPQSEAVPDRTAIEARLAAAKLRYGDAVPRPPHWGGYRVVPEAIEFWQGRENRLHDRIRYRRGGESGEAITWTIDRLAP